MGPGAGGGCAALASVAADVATGAAGSDTGSAVGELAASLAGSGLGVAATAGTIADPSLEGATKLPRGLFRICGCEERCGAWVQAANARSVGTRSE